LYSQIASCMVFAIYYINNCISQIVYLMTDNKNCTIIYIIVFYKMICAN
jgi:hypothetical protein